MPFLKSCCDCISVMHSSLHNVAVLVALVQTFLKSLLSHCEKESTNEAPEQEEGLGARVGP